MTQAVASRATRYPHNLGNHASVPVRVRRAVVRTTVNSKPAARRAAPDVIRMMPATSNRLDGPHRTGVATLLASRRTAEPQRTS